MIPLFSVKADYPSDWEEARIYILSDLHIGDPNANLQEISSRIEQIQNDPNGLCILNGDILNTAIRTGVSDIYAEVLSPTGQIKQAIDMLMPIRKKIIFADTGNHENRIYKTDGVDIMRLMCRELGVENRYCPEGGLCFLKFGNNEHNKKSAKSKMTYMIYATHGTGGGRKEGAKAIRLADMASIVDADIYIHSHTHLPMIMKQAYHRTDIQNSTVTLVDKLFVNDSSSIDYGGYGQAGEFKPSSHTSPVIYLSGTRKAFSAKL